MHSYRFFEVVSILLVLLKNVPLVEEDLFPGIEEQIKLILFYSVIY